ncbi:hypothetical protein OG613_01400 [Streptomyces sp. NBC_00015]|uniref:hypothetical protein n=1 Tax=Streptomyces sp. NBC_00015 TaxID=2903611 RepID=UPI003248AF16
MTTDRTGPKISSWAIADAGDDAVEKRWLDEVPVVVRGSGRLGSADDDFGALGTADGEVVHHSLP